ncbi:hypothetical protein [Nonomuraea basaltis]|uniref:hypothetical protein n=1 Tax=Nonomuraea basaltis TaxID=2495887 RepID=UPI00110C554E|nr:hypothetical protein [Nonomuraea basaltis]TMS00122.1 hypothetical protein EJK15_03360 [Nonomuraea basaltis]
MTHVDDYDEPGDDREPGEPEQEPPISTEELAALLRRVQSVGRSSMWAGVLFDRMPELVDELIAARQRIAEWEALPTREEWTVTGGPNFPVEPGEPTIAPGEQAVVEYARRHETAQLWRRMLSVHPWEPLDEASPF